mmetsp:Transcript_5658/g.13208  ORF Transcript_5658/g.13208 Transcript_5658/m.13208 type:complete len:325 (-) Transcript_5658:421-1395(-)|eukprot:CAMPEP_0113891986 /NCGR_PEP_ID=MMETSP0780_2-20120614/15110_1 /TAXON_ID=652834 /ORGANISM="Palpitomonas bilix" /LENGTH=324 /DNA_ID=CAMNT_0000881763 /DNA_START=296 /DNA_END=1270 /DNA_ORIENTATION=- /assembly_acc=CAM_ASM_000599
MEKKEIFTYDAGFQAYGMGWSQRPNDQRVAIGSMIEEYSNKVHVVKLEEEKNELVQQLEFRHPYPTTKIMWSPDVSAGAKDVIATTGDYLRIWDLHDDTADRRVTLSNNKNSEFCAPLTAFDWNVVDKNMIGTASIDTTCTIWDVNEQKPTTQLIAHDKEVYDMAFAKSNKDLFASVGADGSVRLFDLRRLQHSTIVYESSDLVPLLRIAWNTEDPNYLATIMMDSPTVTVLDIRVPSIPVAELNGHKGAVNSIAWAPHSACHIASASDDGKALIWDLSSIPKPVEEPILEYNSGAEINQMQWSTGCAQWISIALEDKLRILRV